MDGRFKNYEVIKIWKQAGKLYLESERNTAEISRVHKQERELGRCDYLWELEWKLVSLAKRVWIKDNGRRRVRDSKETKISKMYKIVGSFVEQCRLVFWMGTCHCIKKLDTYIDLLIVYTEIGFWLIVKLHTCS